MGVVWRERHAPDDLDPDCPAATRAFRSSVVNVNTHPGLQVALYMLAPDELVVARLMATGELPSPQNYHNVKLYNMRVTGTGVSFRPALNEYVYRKPENYLTQEFLDRCNGLAVIVKHPAGSIMDSDEFIDRVAGTVFLPYIKGDEVWAVVKIYDAEAIKEMEERQLSTSPAVLLSGGEKMELEDGSHLLIEGKPKLLDHLAIGIERGVWDKGGPASGIEQSNLDDAPRADAIEEIGALQRAVNAMAALRMDAAILSSRMTRR